MNANTGLPFLSVIIPVLNAEKTIAQCLTAIEQQDYPNDRYEVIAVDNGSTDDTIAILNTHPQIKFIQDSQRRSPAYARNAGIKKARGEILAFLDADCRANPDWLSKIASAFSDPSIGAVGGEILAWEPKTLVERYQAYRKILSIEYIKATPFGSFPVTANAAYRARVFQEIGSFHPDLPATEDLEFARRMRRETRFTIQMCEQAVVYHKNRQDIPSLWAQQHRNGTGARILRRLGTIEDDPFQLTSPWLFVPIRSFQYIIYLCVNAVRVLMGRRKPFELTAICLDFIAEMGFRFGYQTSATDVSA